jgi:hypothetical protein
MRLSARSRWMGGRAVEGTGLENRQGRKFLVGSNPTPSATFLPAAVRAHPEKRAEPLEEPWRTNFEIDEPTFSRFLDGWLQP